MRVHETVGVDEAAAGEPVEGRRGCTHSVWRKKQSDVGLHVGKRAKEGEGEQIEAEEGQVIAP